MLFLEVLYHLVCVLLCVALLCVMSLLILRKLLEVMKLAEQGVHATDCYPQHWIREDRKGHTL